MALEDEPDMPVEDIEGEAEPEDETEDAPEAEEQAADGILTVLRKTYLCNFRSAT